MRTRRHRSTAGIIFSTRLLQEKCQEKRTYLYATFGDLTKALNTMNREGLGKIMRKFDCPERLTQMLRQFHDGMTARFTDNGVVSEAFAVTNGVNQNCVLGLMFTIMLLNAYCESAPGSASPTERTANSSVISGCSSSRVCPQLPSMNFCSPTTVA
nr:unnamed protein product [Spirometra erinaceieuropaei]